MFKTKIEGSILEVCESCLRFGKGVIEEKPEVIKKSAVEPYKEKETFLVENYGKIIIEARSKKNLSRKEFAERIKEKESVIKRIENEEMIPDDALIEKIEKYLEIKLRKVYEERPVKKEIKKIELTIGDVVEVK